MHEWRGPGRDGESYCVKHVLLVIILVFLIGIVAGLRALTPLAVISWAAHSGWLQLQNTWLGFLGFAATSYITTALALGELITDKLPTTPSRKVPLPFGTRIVSGALCGAALGMDGGAMLGGLFAGAIGAVVGTLCGAALRAQAARMFGKDLPAALLEDVVAIGGALLIVSRFA